MCIKKVNWQIYTLNNLKSQYDLAVESYNRVIDENNSLLKQIPEISKDRVNVLHAIALKDIYFFLNLIENVCYKFPYLDVYSVL